MARVPASRAGAGAAMLAILLAGCSGSEPAGGDADSGAGGESEIASIATCTTPPQNGAILERDVEKGTGPHTVAIVNTSAGSTIVNVRDAASDDLVLSFFVAEGSEAQVSDVPDGNYRIQYATGAALAPDCASFAALQGASQDPETVEFPSGSAMTLTYELTPMVGGNFDGEVIDPAAFAAD